MTRRGPARLIRTGSVDPRVLARHASGVRDDRLLAQAAADVVAYSAEAAFAEEGEAREPVDAAVALARRFAESRELGGDAAYREELERELASRIESDTLEGDGPPGADPAGRRPIMSAATDAAYWCCRVVKFCSRPGAVEDWSPPHVEVRARGEVVSQLFERLLWFAQVAAFRAGELGASGRVFVRSVNGGLRPGGASAEAARAAARGPLA